MADRDHQRTQLILRQKMTDESIAVAGVIYNKMRKVAEGRVLVEYDIGTRLRRVVADEGTYGSHGLEEVAKYVAYRGGAEALYRLMRMATVFTRDWVKCAVNEPMVDGRFLEPGHFLALATLSSWREQQELLDLVRSECLTVRRLTALIRERHPRRR